MLAFAQLLSLKATNVNHHNNESLQNASLYNAFYFFSEKSWKLKSVLS